MSTEKNKFPTKKERKAKAFGELFLLLKKMEDGLIKRGFEWCVEKKEYIKAK